MFDLLLKNVKIVSSKNIELNDILISDGVIKKIAKNIKEKAIRIIDAKEKYLLPGIIDVHVHLREPGGEKAETIESGTKAAIAGGVTTVFDMPNNKPATTTQKALDNKKKIAKNTSWCNLGFYIGASVDNLKSIKNITGAVAIKMYIASTTGNLLINKEEYQDEIFAVKDKLICVHAEDENTIKKISEFYKDQNDPEIHSCIRPNEAAFLAVEKIIKFAKKYDRSIHICHISTKEEIELITKAKEDNLKITCEVTPHHLFMNYDRYTSMGNFVKVNPPLRSEGDREVLWEALTNGVIDMIATDHAPHLKSEKEKDYWQAKAGIPGIEVSLALMLLEVNSGNIDIKKVVNLMCENPAKVFDIKNKGKIKEGFDADLVLVDMEKRKELKTGAIYSKCDWTPYKNWNMKGLPIITIVKGQIVFDDGEFFKPKNVDLI